MGLYDWYTTAKKKLEDGLGAAGNVAQQTAGTIGGAFNSGVSRLGSLADQARNTIASTVSNDVNGVKNYFNNDATAGGILKNTFSPSSLSDSLMNAPEHTFANDISWSNPVQKLGAEIAQGTANTFHGVRDYAKEAANQYYGNTPQDTGKLVGLGGKAALNLAGLGFGGSKVASLAKDSLEVPAAKGMAGVGQAMWQGAKSSVAPGALFGGAYGLADSVQNHQSLPETAANTALSAGSGALFAGGLGSAISGVAPLAKVAVQEGRNIKADLFNLPKAARTITTPVTTETIPAHYVKAGEQPGIVQGLPGEIRTALFPKPSSGEQYGAVRPTGKNTAYQTPGVTRDVMAPVPAQTVTRGGTTVRPFEPQSGLFQWMQKPVLGNSIEDVSRTTKNPNQGDLFSGGARPGSYSHSDIPVVSQSVPPSSVLAPGRNAGMSGLSADQPPLMPVSPGKPLQISSPELGKTPTGNGKIPYTGQSGLDTTTLPNPQQIASDATRALQGAQVKERGFITSVKTGEKTPNAVKQGLAGDYSVLSNEERIALARKAIQDNPEQALKQATNPQSAHDVTIGNQLLDSYIANGQFDKVSALTSRMAEGGTEFGRAVQAFSDYDKTNPAGAVRWAQTKIKEYNRTNPNNPLSLSDADAQALIEKARVVQTMPAGRDRNIATNELMNQINNLIPSTIMDKGLTVWKAGLLTSLRTSARNIAGNIVHGVAEVAKDVPAALTDRLMARSTGNRSMTATLQGVASGTKKGLGIGWDVLRHGYDPEEAIQNFNFNRVTWGDSTGQKVLKWYTEAVFRSLGAQDKPFYHAAYARSLFDQAGTAAINAGKSGDKGFIYQLAANPTESMMENATKDASVATFKNKNIASNVASSLKNALQSAPAGFGKEAGKFVSEVLMPFTGVPSSIAGQTIAYSPVGLLKGIYGVGRVILGNVKSQDLPNIQRQAAQEVGRGVVGTGLYTLGAYLMANNLMTGNPKDANEAAQWALEGKQANSVLIGGKWRSINSIGPEALVMLAGSKIQQMASGKAGVMETALSLGKDQMQQTFLQGVQGPLNAISDPTRYAQSYVGGQIASVVPNIVKDWAKSGDPNQRENNTLLDYTQNSIPGLREMNTPKRDVLGNIMPQEPTGANAFFDLFNSKTPINNPVVSELSRLSVVGNDATPAAWKKSEKVFGNKVQYTPQELDAIEAQTNGKLMPALTQLVTNPTYQSLSDEEKQKLVKNTVEELRKNTKESAYLTTPPSSVAGSTSPVVAVAQAASTSSGVTGTPTDTTLTAGTADSRLMKSPTGKGYLYLDETGAYHPVKDENSGKIALGKIDLTNSENNLLDLGTLGVIRKSVDGTPVFQTRDKYNLDVANASITQAKFYKDENALSDAVKNKGEVLMKLMNDPNTDSVDKKEYQYELDKLQKEKISGGNSESKALTLTEAKMTNAQKKGDYTTWKSLLTVHENQLQAIMSDPNKTEAQRTQAENKLLALQSQAATYARQGGFKYIKQTDTTALDMALIRAHSPSSSRPGSIAAQIFHGRPMRKATRSRSRMLSLNMR